MSNLISEGGCFVIGVLGHSQDNDNFQKNSEPSDFPVCYIACGFQEKRIQNKNFRLYETEGYVYNGFTSPEYRAKGLGAGARVMVCREAKERGYSVLYADISSSNIPSLRMSEKAGAVPCGTFYHLRLLKKSYFISFGSLKNRLKKQTS